MLIGMILAAGALLAGPACQTNGLQEQHAGNLVVEREDAFFRAWEAAPAERRTLAEETLEMLLSEGAPAGTRPSLGALEVATFVLQGADRESLLGEQPGAVMAIQALSMDLIVIPGWFSAREEGEPAAYITVKIQPNYTLRDAYAAQTRLIWLGPNGRSVIAREERVSREAFMGDGFEMYVAPPVSDEGLWHLVLELQPDFSGLVGGLKKSPVGLALVAPMRGIKVPVPCLCAVPEGPGAWEVLEATGLRVPLEGHVLASEWISAKAPAKPTGQGAEVVLVGRSDSWPGPQLGGLVGQRWLQQSGLNLHVVAPFEIDQTGSLRGLLTGFAGSVQPKILVLEGAAVLGAQLDSLRNGPLDVDGLVVVAKTWKPTPSLPKVPTLYITDDGASAQVVRELGDPMVTVILVERSLFLSALEVPGFVATFVSGLQSGASGR